MKGLPGKGNSPNEGFQAQGSPEEGTEDENQLHVCCKFSWAWQGAIYTELYFSDQTHLIEPITPCDQVLTFIRAFKATSRLISPPKIYFPLTHPNQEGEESVPKL